MNYFLQVFGCQMNQSDAERIAGLFESLGMKKASKPEKSDIFVAVMCSVRQMAADRVFGLEQKIKSAKKKNKKFTAILTGCVVKSDKSRFAGIFDHILDIKTLPKWPMAIGLGNLISETDYFHISPKNGCHFQALVPISKGCDNYCTYCVVPYTRGPLESRPLNDILSDIKSAVENGAREIWLLGQNVNNYHYKNITFAGLLRQANDIPGDFWIRFTSPHPKDFSDEVVNAMAECHKVTPYLNLPIQSGDNEVLQTMARPYTVEQYKKLVQKIRQAFKQERKGMEKEIAISTDVIVGFCNESKKQFANTVKVFKSIKFDMAYIAEYSQRAGTAAAKMEDNVPIKEKQKRKKIIDRIVKTTAAAHSKKYAAKSVDVLVDSIKKEFALGKTRSYKTVKFPISGSMIKPGDLVKVKITKTMAFGLFGKKL